MALRKSPVRTAALLAANRANAQKSTGPTTAQGKARVALNALRHGGYAVRLGEKLLRAGYRQSEAQYRWFHEEIAATFVRGLPTDEEQELADRMAARAWCVAGKASGRAKRECGLESEELASRVHVLSRIGIVDRWRRIGLTFWLQRPRYWTSQRQERVMGGDELYAPPPDSRREGRWRRLRFRSRKPGFWEAEMLKRRAERREGRAAAHEADEASETPAPGRSRPLPFGCENTFLRRGLHDNT